MIGFRTDVVVFFYLSIYALPIVSGVKYHNQAFDVMIKHCASKVEMA
jgi:hypothetical protein